MRLSSGFGSCVMGVSCRAHTVVQRPGEEGQRLTEDDVKKFLAGRLANYKALEGGVKFVDAIPNSPSGKILKRILREEARKEIEARAVKAAL